MLLEVVSSYILPLAPFQRNWHKGYYSLPEKKQFAKNCILITQLKNSFCQNLTHFGALLISLAILAEKQLSALPHLQ